MSSVTRYSPRLRPDGTWGRMKEVDLGEWVDYYDTYLPVIETLKAEMIRVELMKALLSCDCGNFDAHTSKCMLTIASKI